MSVFWREFLVSVIVALPLKGTKKQVLPLIFGP